MYRTKSLERVFMFYLVFSLYILSLGYVNSERTVGLSNHTYSLKIIRRKLASYEIDKGEKDFVHSNSSSITFRDLLADSADSGLKNVTFTTEGSLVLRNESDSKNGTYHEDPVIILSANKTSVKPHRKGSKGNRAATSVSTKSTSTSKILQPATTTSTQLTFTITSPITVNTDRNTTQVKTETHNVRRAEGRHVKETPVHDVERVDRNTEMSKESITNDMAESKDDFSQIFKVIQDPEWITSNGDYYIIEFTDQNSTVPIVRLINLSVGLYNKNGDVEEAKRLISAILGSRSLGEPDDEEDAQESDNFFGSGLFDLEDIINWDDLDFMDEMPSLFRKLNNIIWF
ncbi:putative signal peptide-containing protein [Cryptosporidium canis]|uniref:Signal peptide-containing protein n=1 Tax=Cryptosporidium canis TaxID=195482 RepID=A0ABQ8P3C2_9CRYT|nr:putative signal peptide-containing protein [Cryptosporidium canis]